jgi:serine/threonine protein kinase
VTETGGSFTVAESFTNRPSLRRQAGPIRPAPPYNPHPLALTPGTRLGPYEILSTIGAGGMGEVYKARDTRLDRTVAIKVLPADLGTDPQFRERFEREAKNIFSAQSSEHLHAI